MSTAAVIGESLVDRIVGADGVVREVPGGSPMNVAVGLARLGVETTLFTQFGTDRLGGVVARHLAESHVNLARGSVGDVATSTATATIDEAGSAHYSFDIRWSPQLAIPASVDVLHTGSIGALLEPGSERVLELLEAADPDTLVSFDPNIRSGVIGGHAEVVERVERLAAACDVLKMSDEDAAWLYPARSHAQIADEYLERGVSLFVITRGARACVVRTPTHSFEMVPPTVDVTDTIGAGDAFMSGLLFGCLAGHNRKAVLGRSLSLDAGESIVATALQSAAVTVGREGASPPYSGEIVVPSSRPGAAIR